MTEVELRGALTEAIEEALDKMFFVPGLAELSEDAPAEPEVAARVTFEGDPPGRMTLRVTASSARTIAADFLGEDETELPEERVHEVVRELTNMICGAVLSRVESAEDFRLATPWILSQEEQDAEQRGVRHGVDIGGGTMKVAMEMDYQACSPDKKSES